MKRNHFSIDININYVTKWNQRSRFIKWRYGEWAIQLVSSLHQIYKLFSAGMSALILILLMEIEGDSGNQENAVPPNKTLT